MKKNFIRNLPYARILIPDEESGRYSAEVLELPGCFSEGATPQEAYDNIEEACRNWIESAQEQGMEIPAPLGSQGFSGKIALRLPKTIHKKAIQFAAQEGVSLNQFLVSAISARVGAEELMDKIAARIDSSLDKLSNRRVLIIGRTAKDAATDYAWNESSATVRDFFAHVGETAITRETRIH